MRFAWAEYRVGTLLHGWAHVSHQQIHTLLFSTFGTFQNHFMAFLTFSTSHFVESKKSPMAPQKLKKLKKLACNHEVTSIIKLFVLAIDSVGN